VAHYLRGARHPFFCRHSMGKAGRGYDRKFSSATRRHQPHETVLLLIKPVSDRPELLTSTFHVTQGGVEVSGIEWHGTWEKGRTLVIELEKAGRQWGELLFAVPEPYRVKEVRLDGRRRGVNRVAREVVGLGFSLRDRARVELDFER
jgi:hypothetical protein